MINPVYVGAFSPEKDYLWVTWSLLTACNYTCRYCYVRGNGVSKKETDEAVISFIRSAPQKEKEVTLFGGEPTIHPRIMDIVESLVGFSKVHIFTNLSLKDDMMKRLAKNQVHFSVSYHPDIIDALTFIKKFDKLIEFRGNVDFVNVMMVQECQSQEEIVCEYLRNYQIRHRLLPIWREGGGSDWVKSVAYSKRKDVIAIRDTHVIDDRGREYVFSEQECIYLGKDSFTGWKCAAGMRSLFIDYQGLVYRCQADMREGIVFCDSKGEYPKLSFYQCPHNSCTCEYYIPKMRYENLSV